MIKPEDNNFLIEEKKDKAWEFVMLSLKPREPIIVENIPWINQPMLDWNVQVL